MKISPLNRTTYYVKVPRETNWLFMSDVHYDSVKCDRAMLKRHLDEAANRGAVVCIFGDWFDLMGGKWDPRSSYSDIRPEYKSVTYLDDVVEDSYEFLKGYDVALISRGNHETNIEKRMHTSPLDRLAGMLGKSAPTIAGYSGWIKVIQNDNNQNRNSFVHFHHGYGGNAKRSKGVLTVDIDQMQHPDADIMVRGHTHQKWHVPVTIDRISSHGRPYKKTTHHLRTGSYKMLGDGFAGWATEKGFNTPRLGGWFAKSYIRYNSVHWKVEEAT